MNLQVIYAITNTVTGEQYVGSTTFYPSRWEEHRRMLRQGKHNRAFQSAYDKHGANAFAFSILEEVDDANDLRQREQEWCSKLQPAYNACVVLHSAELSEYRRDDEVAMTIAEAQRLLGVSAPKMRRLITDGVLHAETDPLDMRFRVIRRQDVEQLAKTLRPSRREGGD